MELRNQLVQTFLQIFPGTTPGSCCIIIHVVLEIRRNQFLQCQIVNAMKASLRERLRELLVCPLKRNLNCCLVTFVKKLPFLGGFITRTISCHKKRARFPFSTFTSRNNTENRCFKCTSLSTKPFYRFGAVTTSHHSAGARREPTEYHSRPFRCLAAAAAAAIRPVPYALCPWRR